jgi:general secretion pathway protein L
LSGSLFLFPLADDPGAFGWARARVRGRPLERGRASPEEPLAADAGERVILIVAGEEVSLHAVKPPTRSETQALAAARFAIEDDLAEPLEDVAVILAERRKGDDGPMREAAVVSQARLSAWRVELEAIGAAPDCVIPDYAALAPAAGEVLVVDHGDRVLVRGAGLGAALDAALAPPVLAAMLDRRPEDAVRLLSDRPDALLPPQARGGRRVEIGPSPDEEELLALLSDGLEETPALDLARAWRKRGPATPFALAVAPWRATAGLAAAAAAAFLALTGAETLTLRSHARAAEAETERLLHAAFPDMGKVANARAQLRQRLGGVGASASASFLELSAILSESVRSIEAMEVESLRYDGTGGLQATLNYSTYTDMEKLKTAVAAHGGRLAEGASRSRSGGMTGEVVVRR